MPGALTAMSIAATALIVLRVRARRIRFFYLAMRWSLRRLAQSPYRLHKEPESLADRVKWAASAGQSRHALFRAAGQQGQAAGADQHIL